MDNKNPRVLFYDIETSLQPVAVFQLAHNDWINPESILAERHLVSVCWKWLGEKKIYSVSLLDDEKRFKADPHDDYHVAKTFHNILMEADVLISHNGDHFDFRYLKTRMLVHGLDPLPPIASIDTYKIAKSQFLLNSNKLNYVGHLLKVGKKIETSPGLWMRVLNGEVKAIEEMVQYNRQDVNLLEQVYLKLMPYIPNHVNRELFGQTGCPRCGSKKIQSRGLQRAITRTYQRYQCQNPKCMGWFRDLKAEKNSSTKYRVL